MDLRLDEPLLTADEEVALARRMEAGLYAAQLLARGATVHQASTAELEVLVADGRACRARFVRANLRLVAQFARAETHRSGLDPDELFQEGVVGLVVAVDRFDHALGLRFATIAIPWIRSQVDKAVVRRCGELHLSLHDASRRRLALGAAQRLEARLGRRASPAEVADETGLPAQTVRRLLDHEPPRSLTNAEGETMERADPTAVAAFDRVEAQLSGPRISLACLDDDERAVVVARFGLETGTALSYSEVGRRLSVPASRVRRRERAALERMRTELATRPLAA